jgi:threonine/homoserine/homoserine lactone efflux protein
VVVRNTVDGGPLQGVATGLGHGLGVGIYAFAAVAGVSAVVAASPGLHRGIEIAGALFLLWLAFRIVRPGPAGEPPHAPGGRRGFVDGFAIAFLNPKIAVFFLALLGPFLPPETTGPERVGVAVLASAIDAGWYCLVALLMSRVQLGGRHRRVLDAAFAGVLVLVATGLLVF